MKKLLLAVAIVLSQMSCTTPTAKDTASIDTVAIVDTAVNDTVK